MQPENQAHQPQEQVVTTTTSVTPTVNSEQAASNDSSVVELTHPHMSKEAIIAATGEVAVSKRQLKKQKNREKRRESFKQKKLSQKEQRKRKRQEVAQDLEQRKKAMTEEELKLLEVEKMNQSRQLTCNRKEYKANKQNRMREVYQKGTSHAVSVIVDCSFNDKMTPREIVSMSQQLMFCYSANGKMEKSDQPMFLSFTSLKGALLEAMKKFGGFPKWIVDHTPEHFTERFSEELANQKIVYLSADAEEEVTSLEPGCMYVLGGLVDRNRHKNLCHEKAKELGIPQKRFPIGQYLNMKQAPVLTVNQCFEIMAHVYETGSWKEAVEKVVPQRKRASGDKEEKEDDNEENNQEGDEESEETEEAEAEQDDKATVELEQ